MQRSTISATAEDQTPLRLAQMSSYAPTATFELAERAEALLVLGHDLLRAQPAGLGARSEEVRNALYAEVEMGKRTVVELGS